MRRWRALALLLAAHVAGGHSSWDTTPPDRGLTGSTGASHPLDVRCCEQLEVSAPTPPESTSPSATNPIQAVIQYGVPCFFHRRKSAHNCGTGSGDFA
jgi:hypothetical protein